MSQLGRDGLLTAYRTMATIRQFEERLHDEIKTGEIAGFTHLYAGQEAAAVGVDLAVSRVDDCFAGDAEAAEPFQHDVEAAVL